MKSRVFTLCLLVFIAAVLLFITGCLPVPNTLPTISKSSGPSGTISQSSSTFSWNGNDPDGTISKYEYRKDGGSWKSDVYNGYTWSGYSEGYHTFEFRVQDNEGAYSNIIIWSFTYEYYPAPGKPQQPNPADGAVVGEGSVTELRWVCPSPLASSYKVYFGETINPPVVSIVDINVFELQSNLERGVTYYWKIEACNESGCTMGDLWNFTVYVPEKSSISGYCEDIFGDYLQGAYIKYYLYKSSTLIASQEIFHSGTAYGTPVTKYFKFDNLDFGTYEVEARLKNTDGSYDYYGRRSFGTIYEEDIVDFVYQDFSKGSVTVELQWVGGAAASKAGCYGIRLWKDNTWPLSNELLSERILYFPYVNLYSRVAFVGYSGASYFVEVFRSDNRGSSTIDWSNRIAKYDFSVGSNANEVVYVDIGLFD